MRTVGFSGVSYSKYTVSSSNVSTKRCCSKFNILIKKHEYISNFLEIKLRVEIGLCDFLIVNKREAKDSKRNIQIHE